MRVIISFIIKLYQYLLSPVLPVNCKFYPSCSEYALHALQKHSLTKGLWLSFYRILRCNPWSLGGYDPVLSDKKEKI